MGIIFSFLIGTCFGSFLNCLVYRLSKKRTILGRSFCPKCLHKLSWSENIPLFSFFFLKGKCKHCHQSISWQYPLIELAVGLLFAIAFARLSLPLVEQSSLRDFAFIFSIKTILSLFIQWFIFFILIFIFIYDLRYQEIELIVLWPAIAVVLLSSILKGTIFQEGLFILKQPFFISLLIGTSFFLLQYLITKGKGIGLGDVWVGIFMATILVQPKNLCIALFSAYVIGALVGLFLLIFYAKSGKYKLKTKIPLAPFLVLGTFIAIFWGEKIINFYLSKL